MAKKERKLTPAEEKRKTAFLEKANELTALGYERKDLTISVMRANIMALVIMLPFIILFFWLFFVVNNTSVTLPLPIRKGLLFLFFIVVLTVVHEGIHGLTWGIFAKNHLRSIAFGVIWEMMTPYCTCKEALTKWQYVVGSLMPTMIVGILPAVYGVIFGDSLVFLIAIVMILGGGGDVLITLKLLFYKTNGKEAIYMDHPCECGLVVFEQERKL